jgi:hypothetical protein
MQQAALPSISTPSILVRFLIAFLLGLQLGLIVFIPPSLPWLNMGPVAVLLVALLLSILLHPHMRQSGRLAPALLRVLLVIALPLLALVGLGGVLPTAGSLVAVGSALALSVIVAFTVGSETVSLAIGSGLIAWAGAGSLFLLAAFLQSMKTGNDLGSLVFGVIAVLVVLGFGIAPLGGLLSRRLRKWVVG